MLTRVVVEPAELDDLEAALGMAQVGHSRECSMFLFPGSKVTYTVVTHPVQSHNSSVLVDVEMDQPE